MKKTVEKTNLIDLMNELKGTKFVGVRGYESGATGKVAHYVVNVNVDINKAKAKDLELLKTVTKEQLLELSKKSDIALDVFELALSELIASSTQNTNKDKSKRTNSSKGQTDAYVNLTNNGIIKFNKNHNTVHFFAMKNSEVPVKEGTYKPTKSHAKTIAKRMITKKMDLRMSHFRNFKIEGIDTIKAMGGTYDIDTNVYTYPSDFKGF